MADDGSGAHSYALIAVGADGRRSDVSRATRASGLARLRWDSDAGVDAYIVVRDGKATGRPLRIEGSRKVWKDPRSK